ncbi:hypothetical protein A3Q56_07650 [Intoshia linei]|uniref:Proline dehydrogenase n=1 Tax=Intoshia linei TaxID=1819745 RepID=A0A177ARN0_9BILA|nr:hypothetical protein A3Q56_07650 [Intoshia linei]
MYLLQKQFVKCSVNGKFRLFMAMSRRASSTMYSNTYTVSFDNYERAFKSKKSMQLVKSMCIYKACSYPWLVKNSEMLMNGTKSMLGTNFYNALVKKTIYSQFVAGENGPEIENTIKRFNEVNVRPLMVYSIENEW